MVAFFSEGNRESKKEGNPMKKIIFLSSLAVLAACEPPSEFLGELPDQVVQLVAPNQNLQAVKLLEEDNCYWYQHDGPVETTLLPLMSVNGGHICLRREGEAA